MTTSTLQSQWLNLCSQIGINGSEQWKAIHSAYTTPSLAYHNLTHIADCLEKFSHRESESTNPAAVKLAIWFHDLVYNPRAPDNEERSADVASKLLADTPHAGTVHRLILATKHTIDLTDQDEKLLCDIDLSILGSPPKKYQQYAIAIRDEYSWVPEPDYQKGRSNVLQSFLDRPSIYALKTSQHLYEAQARHNILSEIKTLSSQT